MSTITLEEAQANLGAVIDGLSPGAEVVVTRDGVPAAVIASPPAVKKPARKLGFLKGTVLYMAPDFDAPLDGEDDEDPDLTPLPGATPIPGRVKGMITILDDSDDLEDFAEYM